MNILLTGATGFLGSRLARALLKEGHGVIAVKRSFDDTANLEGVLGEITFHDLDRDDPAAVFAQLRIDVILHTATNYGRTGDSIRNIIDCNFLLPLKLMELGVKNAARCFINTDTVLDKFTNSYSLSKKQLLEWLVFYSGSLALVNMRLEHMYGPGDSEIKFVTQMVRRMLAGEREIPLTEGRQKRDFIYIDDAVAAFLAVIRSIRDFTAPYLDFEVGSGRPCAISELVTMIRELTDSPSVLKFGAVPYRQNEMMESHVDLTAIAKLGWSPTVELAEGLRKTIEYERNRNVQSR